MRQSWTSWGSSLTVKPGPKAWWLAYPFLPRVGSRRRSSTDCSWQVLPIHPWAFPGNRDRRSRLRPRAAAQRRDEAPNNLLYPSRSRCRRDPAPAKVLSAAETQRLLKRCSRQILLVMEDNLEREFLAARLRAEGFRGIHEARGWLPTLHKTRKVALDLILMNQQVGPNAALEILDSLRSNGLSDQVRMVVLKQQEDVRLTLASKAGRLMLVSAQPLAFKEVLVPGLEELLGLSG